MIAPLHVLSDQFNVRDRKRMTRAVTGMSGGGGSVKDHIVCVWGGGVSERAGACAAKAGLGVGRSGKIKEGTGASKYCKMSNPERGHTREKVAALGLSFLGGLLRFSPPSLFAAAAIGTRRTQAEAACCLCLGNCFS